jgi:hypothetical protein
MRFRSKHNPCVGYLNLKTDLQFFVHVTVIYFTSLQHVEMELSMINDPPFMKPALAEPPSEYAYSSKRIGNLEKPTEVLHGELITRRRF